MDILKLLFDLSELNPKDYKDVLLKKINNNNYYVMDFSNQKGVWEFNLLKVEGIAEDISKRIRLYDQPSASKIGFSLPISTYLGNKNIVKILENLKVSLVGKSFLKDIDEILFTIKNDFVYPETEKEIVELYGEKYKGIRGYCTLSINGRYVVDEFGYDEEVIKNLYLGMRKGINEDDFCSLCGIGENLLHGGYKEPGWKLLSTTRTTEVGSNGKVFIRCNSCEEKVMKGMDLLQSFVKVDYTKNGNFERVIIPLVKEKRWFEKIINLRKEYSSDLKFYEEMDRLIERLEMRGIDNYLYLRLVKNQRSYAVLDIREVRKEDIHKLQFKSSYEKLLWDNNWLKDGKEINYFPKDLLDFDDSYKWKLIERVKMYWLGLEEDKRLWKELEKLFGNSLVEYSLWSDYLLKGDKMVDEIKESKSYLLGRLMNKARMLQEVDKGISSRNSITSIQKRFYGYPNDLERAFEEVMKVIDYRIKKIGRKEREEVSNFVEMYVRSTSTGDSRGYYLGLYERVKN